MKPITLCSPDLMADLAKKGDLEALDRLSRCYGRRLVQIGRRYCRNAEDAQDAVQDAMVQAAVNLDHYRGEGPLEAWVGRMVARACSRMRRGRKNDPGLHTTEVMLTAEEPSPEAEARRGEMAEKLGQSLQVLDPVDRTLVLLAEVEGWTGPQLAERTGLSAPAVRKRLSRARKRLASSMEEMVEEPL